MQFPRKDAPGFVRQSGSGYTRRGMLKAAGIAMAAATVPTVSPFTTRALAQDVEPRLACEAHPEVRGTHRQGSCGERPRAPAARAAPRRQTRRAARGDTPWASVRRSPGISEYSPRIRATRDSGSDMLTVAFTHHP